MKKHLFSFSMVIALCCAPIFAENIDSQDVITAQANQILQRMSLREKIGQKLMLDFRYWCASPSPDVACTEDFTTINPHVKKIMTDSHIGGIILFANNLKDIAQITALTHAFQQAMVFSHNLPLLIGTDQEGGIVARLPRDVAVTFPGNMAMTAAYLGNPGQFYVTDVAKMIAKDLKAVGINIDFAPDVDVNINPLNPVINVRSFSDEPRLVSQLGLQYSMGIQAMGVGSTLKHFPGHGDTNTDSHLGLPVVDHTLEQARKIDLYPFKNIIKASPPDLIMTAHIQFPALDNSEIYASKAGKNIIAPATLSHKIQHDLLREQLGFKGVVVTDALDMGAIVQNFDASDATIKSFQAGDDIALMPVSINRPADVNKVDQLVTKIVAEVTKGNISEVELNQSVLRILKLKIKLGLLKPDSLSLPEKIVRAQKLLAKPNQKELESLVTDDAITMVQNNNKLLPIKLSAGTRIHILMPLLEQGVGIAKEITVLQEQHYLPQKLTVSFARIADTNLASEKLAVDNADIIIVGDSTTTMFSLTNNLKTLSAKLVPPSGSLVFPEIPDGDAMDASPKPSLFKATMDSNAAKFAYDVLQYAKLQHKKTIFISLEAPYDLPNYRLVADAMLAGYDFYGYLTVGDQGYFRGPSMQALTRIIFGIHRASAKLPINIPDPDKADHLIYQRGFGLV